MSTPSGPFDLQRLLKTVFDPQPGEHVTILIDLPNPRDVIHFKFLQNPQLSIQKYAHDIFYQGLQCGVLKQLGLTGGNFFAYKETGGSNLDLPDQAFSPEGQELSLTRDVFPKTDIVLCISTYSATAPLTALAKTVGFRGATMHGLNAIILETGLSVDYNLVSQDAEKMRQKMTRADRFELEFQIAGKTLNLKLDCSQQEAQKSHGLCRGKVPDIANLPAGEVYFVPTGAEGQFPMRYESGTLAIAKIRDGRVVEMELISGNSNEVDIHNQLLQSDPATGVIGELGFGTQTLPPSGRDIQDEKILGTFHVATGRNDHLGGHLTPQEFHEKRHATHDDILFAPWKTPEVTGVRVTMVRDGKTQDIITNYVPTSYLHL
ncbi:MAG: hypothetical protein COV45_06695 [Deltaproteobacteria bacterium CG11_big_fil_rev_8_21_14_0_20_47_16]|nr:MAG: hypothetical protein COV45_06695 [Deltaproteobacteria bacterium CG11_big_fil_rev_8_21_14_0_20_47_16]